MAGSEEKEWFYMSLGHRRGPVTQESLKAMLLNEELFIESTQVWREGMKEWDELADSKAFAPTLKKVRESAQKSEANVRHAASSSKVDEDLVCRGVSRALFNFFFYIGWVIPVLLGVIIITELQAYQLLDAVTVNEYNLQYVLPIGFLLLTMLQVAISRMRHAGYTAWLGATIFLPIWNLFILFVCLFTPQNFKRKKKLGKAAIGYFVLFSVMIAVPFVGLIPGVNLQSLNLVSLTDGITNTYKFQTSYNARLKKNVDKASSAEARRKAMEENQKKTEGRGGALREHQNQLK